MSKIIKVSPGAHGHLHLDLEDGTSKVIHRGEHEHHELKVGDHWPPPPFDEPKEAPEETEEEGSPTPQPTIGERLRRALGPK